MSGDGGERFTYVGSPQEIAHVDGLIRVLIDYE